MDVTAFYTLLVLFVRAEAGTLQQTLGKYLYVICSLCGERNNTTGETGLICNSQFYATV